MKQEQYEELKHEFTRLQRHVEAALIFAGGSHTRQDVWDMVAKEKAQLWFGPDSIIVTEIQTTPRMKILHFWLAGGSLGELERMYPLIEEWGVAMGCTQATLTGRKGWERTFLQRLGWTYAHTTFAKELSHVERIDTDDDDGT